MSWNAKWQNSKHANQLFDSLNYFTIKHSYFILLSLPHTAPVFCAQLLRLSSIRNRAALALFSVRIKGILNQEWGWFIAMTGTDQIEHTTTAGYIDPPMRQNVMSGQHSFQEPPPPPWSSSVSFLLTLMRLSPKTPQTGMELGRKAACERESGQWKSGLNRAPRTGFVNWKPRRESTDPSAGVSWDLRTNC